MYARATFIGRATKDCDVVELPSGMVKANFSIATNAKRDETAFFDLTAFDKTAEVCGNYVKKGKLIFAEGAAVMTNRYFHFSVCNKIQLNV